MSDLDLRDNISALTIAICHKDYLLPEEVLGTLEGEKERSIESLMKIERTCSD